MFLRIGWQAFELAANGDRSSQQALLVSLECIEIGQVQCCHCCLSPNCPPCIADDAGGQIRRGVMEDARRCGLSHQ